MNVEQELDRLLVGRLRRAAFDLQVGIRQLRAENCELSQQLENTQHQLQVFIDGCRHCPVSIRELTE